MPSYKTYETSEYESWLKQKFSYNYGISEEKIADHFMASGTPVISKYGITKSQLLDTYIPELKNGLSGGYVFFLLYTITEGGGAGNWVNHYMSDTSSGGLATMKDDIRYLNSLDKSVPVAKSAPEVLGGANFIEDNPGEVDKFYTSISTKSVGMLFMPSTLAGNAWVWAEQWCLNNQGSAPPSTYFGNPYDQIIQTIKDLGGDPFGSSGGSDDDGGSDDGGSDTGGDIGGVIDNTLEIIKKAMTDLIEKIKDAMNWHLHSIGTDKYFSNTMFKLEKTFNNTYKISMGQKLLDNMSDLINSIDTGGSDGEAGNPVDDDNDPPDPPSDSGGKGESVKPNGKNGSVIGGNWTYDELPQKYKDSIKIPLFKGTHLGQSPFMNTGDTGQCTELTWAYMWELWGKEQPAWDNQITNGQRVWYVYKNLGAKTTHSPTVGYGFSSKPPYLQASLYGVGHTGVVVAVYDDGSFLVANYNVPPLLAPSRQLYYTLINGVPENAGDNIVFFSGIA